MKEAFLKDMSKKASRFVCTSTVVESSNSLSAIPSSSSGVKTPENTEQDPDVPEPSMEISKQNTPLTICAA
jgi:hypothetical protein